MKNRLALSSALLSPPIPPHSENQSHAEVLTAFAAARARLAEAQGNLARLNAQQAELAAARELPATAPAQFQDCDLQKRFWALVATSAETEVKRLLASYAPGADALVHRVRSAQKKLVDAVESLVFEHLKPLFIDDAADAGMRWNQRVELNHVIGSTLLAQRVRRMLRQTLFLSDLGNDAQRFEPFIPAYEAEIEWCERCLAALQRLDTPVGDPLLGLPISVFSRPDDGTTATKRFDPAFVSPQLKRRMERQRRIEFLRGELHRYLVALDTIRVSGRYSTPEEAGIVVTDPRKELEKLEREEAQENQASTPETASVN